MKIFIILLSYFAPSYSLLLPPIHILDTVTHSIPHDLKIKIVEDTTSILPKLDWFGHMMLTNNEKLISFVLNTNFDDSIKKELILNIIDLCRKGDETGGVILENYYNLIDKIL